MKDLQPELVKCSWYPYEECAGMHAHDHLRGTVVFAGVADSISADACAAPWLRVPMPALTTAGLPAAVGEVWFGAQALSYGPRGFLRYSLGKNILFGAMQLDESDFIVQRVGETPLQGASEMAYRALFALLDESGFAHLLRVWNYLADINGSSHGLERYRQFNIGRQDAYLGCGRPVTGNVPAASALGFAAGPLTIYFLAGRGPAPLLIENPRQVSAYHYPSGYGPRSPTFSRASLARPGGRPVLFISGTASIVGHASVHGGDVLAQTRETMVNIGVLVEGAARLAPEAGFTLEGLCYKVYLRDARDVPAVRAELLRQLGPAAQLIFLQADICRAELAIEIEALGGPAEDFSVRR